MKLLAKRLVLAALIFGALTLSADATTITFNGTAPEGTSASIGATYSEGGYTVTSDGGLMFFVDNSDVAFPGVSSFDDDVLEFNSESGAFFTLTADGGGAFDLVSVKTGSLGRDAFDDGNFIFTGYFAGGGSISQLVQGIGSSPGTTTFAGFTNLLSVTVSSSDGWFPVLDDLTVTASVPDSGSTLTLLGIVMSAMAVARRKIKR